jgi:hypothetical protein
MFAHALSNATVRAMALFAGKMPSGRYFTTAKLGVYMSQVLPPHFKDVFYLIQVTLSSEKINR